MCTHQDICSFVQLAAPTSSALGIFNPYSFYCNQYPWLTCGLYFHNIAYAFTTVCLGESLLRGDSSERRWNASISAWEFKDPGLRSWLSDLETEGVGLVELCGSALAVPCAAYQGGWRAMWETPCCGWGASPGEVCRKAWWVWGVRGLLRVQWPLVARDDWGHQLYNLNKPSSQHSPLPLVSNHLEIFCIMFMIVVDWSSVLVGWV